MEYSARLGALLVLIVLAAGCASPDAETRTPTATTSTTPTRGTVADEYVWPDLAGETLTILDHGAFGAFEDAKKLFENRTGATLVHVSADDSGSALRRAALEKGDPTFDIIYGIDNVLWTEAIAEGIFEPYKPAHASRIDPAYVFFDGTAAQRGTDGSADPSRTWHATPVDHGYIGVNVDEATLGASVANLDALKLHASEFVTEDPRTSTPGLGFLLATIATYGEDGWETYWADLFEGGVLVTSGWTEAYEQHFTAGYGVDMGGRADKPIVTSYTSSPAYEAYFGRDTATLATPLVAPQSTFHQIQTMGIAKGTKHLEAAQAWIEFTLTDEFQTLAAPGNAVYPIVASIDTDTTYGTHDPTPGSFEPATMTANTIGTNLETWLTQWTNLCEQHDCA